MKTFPEVMQSIENMTEEEHEYNKQGVFKRQEEKSLIQLRNDVFQHILLKQEDHASERIVEYFENKYHIFSIKNDRVQEIYYYEDGQLNPNGECFLKEKIREILLHAFTTQRSNRIIVKICADNGYDLDDLHKRESENINEIPTKNGILNLKTKELSEFTPEKIFFNKINAKYDPDADCPKIKDFLRSIVEDEADVNVIFEIIGSTLYKKYFMQKIVMFIGEGENGKGWLCSLIRDFLNSANCQALPLAQLTPDCYEVKDLRGSLANIAGDISNTALKDTGLLKELSSGTDAITAKRKFMDSLGFVNYAKLIFSCNELPRVYDFSHGFWRRWLLLQFPYTFLKEDEYVLRKDELNVKKANPELFAQITTEKEFSGLLNEALKGLDRLLKKKQFSYTKSTADVKDMWIRKSDSFTAFCFDNLESDPIGVICKRDMAKAYNKYCKKHRIPGTSAQSIKRTLQELFGCIEDRKVINMTQEWVWEGIKYKGNLEKSKESNKIQPLEKNKITTLDENKPLIQLIDNSKEQNSKFTDEELKKMGYSDEEIKDLLEDYRK